MKKSILLAVEAADIEQAKMVVESATGSTFAAHQSDYHGGSYFRSQSSDISLVLQENFIEDDGEPTEAAFPEAKLLVYVDGGATDADKVVAKLEAAQAVRVLRSSIY